MISSRHGLPLAAFLVTVVLAYLAGRDAVEVQAVASDGTLLHDFLLKRTARCLHVCNAPSPAATSAIPIGRHICEQLSS